MEQETANVILGKSGPADGFIIKYGIFKFKLKIKPLTARQVIEISAEISKIPEIDQTKDMFPSLLERSNDLIHISKAISIATGTRFRRIVARSIRELELLDIQTLFNIVKKQCDAEVFFYIIILAKGMNKLTPKEQ